MTRKTLTTITTDDPFGLSPLPDYGHDHKIYATIERLSVQN
jgi:hypothetical protein